MSDKEHKIEYRVVRQKKDGDEWLSIQEVYFDGDDKAYAHTVDLEITGDTISEIRKKLQSIIWALDKDLITEIQNDVMEDDMEKRMLDVEMENAELRDRLEELGEKVKYQVWYKDAGDGHMLKPSEEWIYESPDGGKTTFRRPIGEYDINKKEEVDMVTGKPTGRMFKDYPFKDKVEKGL